MSKNISETRPEYPGLDYFRMIAAILIIAIHTYPLKSINTDADFILCRVIGRTAVPFFFMVTGFFTLPACKKRKSSRKRFFTHLARLYGAALVIYLPVCFYSGYFKDNFSLPKLLKDFLFNGIFYHLWYLPAVILGMALLLLLHKFFKKPAILGIVAVLYLIGLAGDSYYGFISQAPGIHSMYDFLFKLFDYTRNGLFFAPFFLFAGELIAAQKDTLSKRTCLTGLGVSFLLLLTEALLLRHWNLPRHDSMYFMLIPCMFFLFQTLRLCTSKKASPSDRKPLRTISMAVYIIHPLCIILVRGFAKIAGLQDFLVENNLVHFIMVTLVSLILSLLYTCILSIIKEKKECPENI